MSAGNPNLITMIGNLKFDSQLHSLLPETYTLVKSSNLVIHDSVSRVILCGSRGPAGGARPDSDIDITLIVDIATSLTREKTTNLLQNVMETTLNNWQSKTELDLAVVFDIRNCGLKCFDRIEWDEESCLYGGIDCFGLYKTQKGYQGLVTNAGVQVKFMHPSLKIWSGE